MNWQNGTFCLKAVTMISHLWIRQSSVRQHGMCWSKRTELLIYFHSAFSTDIRKLLNAFAFDKLFLALFLLLRFSGTFMFPPYSRHHYSANGRSWRCTWRLTIEMANTCSLGKNPNQQALSHSPSSPRSPFLCLLSLHPQRTWLWRRGRVLMALILRTASTCAVRRVCCTHSGLYSWWVLLYEAGDPGS